MKNISKLLTTLTLTLISAVPTFAETVAVQFDEAELSRNIEHCQSFSSNAESTQVAIKGLLKIETQLNKAHYGIVARLNAAPNGQAQEKHLKDLDLLNEVRTEIHAIVAELGSLDCNSDAAAYALAAKGRATVSKGITLGASLLQENNAINDSLKSGISTMLSLANNRYTLSMVGYYRLAQMIGLDNETSRLLENFLERGIVLKDEL